ncbi:MAG: hypothetical protein A2161_05250 [Candidatus Schekmanbacteria bacterium RBG_13_48_7]|uniref:Uncharacterized protein n=1 Tax=Candidatus Schekmanbacteria bacterium RBG_13_48_7 TaxID=1817878 RepID=A0A1F7S6M4_9BACT|nr:MAG: hypothetical protein A2161_05250 [Candidatus Schekmanbacteria bacterium RBG_13_48_7]
MMRKIIKVTNFVLMWLILVFIISGLSCSKNQENIGEKSEDTPVASEKSQTKLPGMQKYVTEQATFILYLPTGWKAAEGTQPGFRTVISSDPSELYEVAMFYGVSPTGKDVEALTRLFIAGIGNQFPDLKLQNVMSSADKKRITLDASFTHPEKGQRIFKAWISVTDTNFVYSSIETPYGKFEQEKQLLLTILSNIRIIKGAYNRNQSAIVNPELTTYRLRDGSASFSIPRGWKVNERGSGQFAAISPDKQSSFIAGTISIMSPTMGVKVPGYLISPYLNPHNAFQFITSSQGLASDMLFVEVNQETEIARQISKVYTAGAVTVENFIYTCQTKNGKTKGYTIGFSFGTRLNTNWSFQHLTVTAPEDKFDSFAETFAYMIQSYTINEAWAKNYVAQGLSRLRQLQQQTSRMVARNALEIHEMMQAAYDERQKSQDYIDYQRTNFIRDEQDWISNMEGGTVYHTDNWGTQNTTTGEYWEGQPFDSIHFQGDNPKHNEQMIPIDSRKLWEQNIP